MKCPKCNREINDTVNFCKYCGVKIENSDSEIEDSDSTNIKSKLFIVCPICGKEMHIHKIFCTNCGNQLNGTNTIDNISISKNANKLKRKRLKIIICLLVVLVIVSAVITTMYLKNPDYNKSNNVVEKINEEKPLDVNEKDSSEEDKKDKNNKGQNEVDLEIGVNSEEIEKKDEEIEQINVAEEITMQKIKTISSSSALSEYNMTHSVDRVVDENITTAWVEGVAGQGIGEYILFEFDGEYSVKGFEIYAGYQKDYSLYEKNSRPKEIILEFSDGTQETYVLGDSMKKQSIVFEDEKTTDLIKVVIKEIYAGNEYEDTVISEIKFY